MFINYKNKDFVGFDDINHKGLYLRHKNLKKTKEDLSKKRCFVKNTNVYSVIFDKYDFYNNLNYKILELINLYRKENLDYHIEYLNKKYKENVEKIISSGKNNSRIFLSIRIIWAVTFFKEYFIFWFILIKNKFLNEFRKGNRIK